MIDVADYDDAGSVGFSIISISETSNNQITAVTGHRYECNVVI